MSCYNFYPWKTDSHNFVWKIQFEKQVNNDAASLIAPSFFNQSFNHIPDPWLSALNMQNLQGQYFCSCISRAPTSAMHNSTPATAALRACHNLPARRSCARTPLHTDHSLWVKHGQQSPWLTCSVTSRGPCVMLLCYNTCSTLHAIVG